MSLPDAFVEVEYWDAQHESVLYLKMLKRDARVLPPHIDVWMSEQEETWRFVCRG